MLQQIVALPDLHYLHDNFAVVIIICIIFKNVAMLPPIGTEQVTGRATDAACVDGGMCCRAVPAISFYNAELKHWNSQVDFMRDLSPSIWTK